MKNARTKKILKWSLLTSTVLLAVIQLANPSLKNPPVVPGHDLMATNPPPQQVAKLLHDACYDCHSNETRWPWYAHVAPVSWWINHHMREGRADLNFSEWPHNDAYVAADQLDHIVHQVEKHKMPLPSYTWLGLHPDARLTDLQRGEIAKWAEQEAQRLGAAQ